MAEFKLPLATPAVFVHGVTCQDTETTVLPVGTRYSFDGEPNPITGRTYILVEDPDQPELLYRYRVLTEDLAGVAI